MMSLNYLNQNHRCLIGFLKDIFHTVMDGFKSNTFLILAAISYYQSPTVLFSLTWFHYLTDISWTCFLILWSFSWNRSHCLTTQDSVIFVRVFLEWPLIKMRILKFVQSWKIIFSPILYFPSIKNFVLVLLIYFFQIFLL